MVKKQYIEGKYDECTLFATNGELSTAVNIFLDKALYLFVTQKEVFVQRKMQMLSKPER